MPRPFKAIAAMAQNRVIGRENKLPWHLPEELKWFKKMTLNQVVIMGRKTFESLGKPLPNRETIVISRRGGSYPGVRTVGSLEEISREGDGREFFVIGGGEVFRDALPLCSDLYLTVVKREVEGDVFFPPFEHLFDLAGTIQENNDFVIQHYRNRQLNSHDPGEER